MALRLAVLAIGALIGVPTFALAQGRGAFSFTGGRPFGLTLLALAGGLLVVAAAAAVGLRRWWMWLLTLLLAVAWFAMEWSNPASPAVVFTAGLLLYATVPAVALNLATAHAHRLGGWFGRVLVSSGYLVFVGVEGWWPALRYDPRAEGCPSCPANLVAVDSDQAAWVEITARGVWIGTAVLGLAICTLLWWWWSARSTNRRDDGAIVLTCVAVLGVWLAYHIHSLPVGLLSADGVDQRLWQGQALTLMAVAAAVILDAMRSRRMRRAMTTVVHGLGGSGSQVGDRLAARLGDPSLAVAFHLDDGRLVDSHGAVVDPMGRTDTRIDRDHRQLATVLHRPDIPSDLVAELAGAVHLALDHERLQAQALAQLSDIRLSGERIVATGDAQRGQLEHDLHDGAQQHLVTLLLALRLAQNSPEDLVEVERLLESAVERLRTIAHGLYPTLLERAGLAAALQALAESRALRVDLQVPAELPVLTASTVYLIVERASQQAPSHAWIRCSAEAVELQMRVTGPVPDLADVADRVLTLNGTTRVDTSAGATTIIASIPMSGMRQRLSTAPRQADAHP